MSEKSIIVENLHKSYDKKEVIKGISFTVSKGELFGFIGKNGVGKSTTIESIIGVKEFNEGEILLNGYSIKSAPLKAKEQFGYVSSEPIAYENMTGKGYINFVASIYNVKKEDFLERYQRLKDILQIDDKDLARPIAEYSHGMKQKVCLIASLIHNPSIWILDEPTVGLDAYTAYMLTNLMREYADKGNTCFVTSHNIDLIAQICDRVALIKDGLIAKIYDLKNEPKQRETLTKEFIQILKGDEIDM